MESQIRWSKSPQELPFAHGCKTWTWPCPQLPFGEFGWYQISRRNRSPAFASSCKIWQQEGSADIAPSWCASRFQEQRRKAAIACRYWWRARCNCDPAPKRVEWHQSRWGFTEAEDACKITGRRQVVWVESRNPQRVLKGFEYIWGCTVSIQRIVLSQNTPNSNTTIPGHVTKALLGASGHDSCLESCITGTTFSWPWWWLLVSSVNQGNQVILSWYYMYLIWRANAWVDLSALYQRLLCQKGLTDSVIHKTVTPKSEKKPVKICTACKHLWTFRLSSSIIQRILKRIASLRRWL